MKSKLTLISLMVLPFIFSCNKVNSKINSQEDLVNALKFNDVQFIQAEFNKRGKGAYVYECSPTVFALKFGEDGAYQSYCEKTADNKYYEYTLKETKWVKEETTESHFTIPQMLYDEFDFEGMLEYMKYENFEYEKGQYNCKTGPYAFTLRFSNKKIIYLQISTSGEELSRFNFTYKKFTPKLPEVEN